VTGPSGTTQNENKVTPFSFLLLPFGRNQFQLDFRQLKRDEIESCIA
jgi:hypothetical protein